MSSQRNLFFAFSSGAIAFAVTAWINHKFIKNRSFLHSPRVTVLPRLPQTKIDCLPYPPDAFPGGRDVETPYGTIKVFEWGPESGRKVLFIHGISTPCIAFGQVAQSLVERGCRVMLFDLFGRGFSDAPLDLPHDSRLYTTQILLALASSPIPWTGISAFDIVGYSFGGGVSANFTRYFPSLVRTVIFVAPGGVVRTSHINWRSKFLYSVGIFPERMLEYFVKKRLSPSLSQTNQQNQNSKRLENPVAESAIAAEVGSTAGKRSRESTGEGNQEVELAHAGRHVNPDAASAWQLEHHVGFIPAFMSSIRHGPIHDQHADWIILGKRLTEKRNSVPATDEFPMKIGKPRALLVLGDEDVLVLKDEVALDVREVLGESNVKVTIVDGGHEFPISNAKGLVEAIRMFWESKDYLELLEN